MRHGIDFEKTLAEFKDRNLPSGTWETAFAFEIILEFFGIDFIKREFLGGEKDLDVSFTNIIDDPFFVYFADLLWCLKSCKGFHEFTKREKNRSKESVWLLMDSKCLEY